MGLSNALLAGLLALLALAVGRFSRRPALVHSLWVLVLIKLVTPPLVPLPVPGWRQPAAQASPAPAPAGEAAAGPLALAPVPLPPAEEPRPEGAAVMRIEDIG